MRRILIVGAGQSGLQLALSLQRADYDVTVVSARTPDEIRAGRIMSAQCMFHPALDIERRHGLGHWDDEAPRIAALSVTLSRPHGVAALDFVGRWDSFAQSVDQRVKTAHWLELFERRGGRVRLQSVAAADLEGLAERYDLTVVAAGKGDLSGLFERDASRSPFSRPQRRLSCIYLRGMGQRPDHPEHQVRISAFPGIGELFYVPGLTTTGHADILLWEAVPGGPLDCWDDRPDPQAHLARTLDLLRRYAPWEHERAVDAEPTDPQCTLVGGYPPTVRRPVGRLSDTASVLGMADAVVANDPIAGQGANNAAHCAEIYFRAIVDNGSRAFDEPWMQRTFDAYWSYARHPTDYSTMLLGPLPDHVQRVLAAAAEDRRVADRFAGGYADPTDLRHWLLDPQRTEAYLASVAAGGPG